MQSENKELLIVKRKNHIDYLTIMMRQNEGIKRENLLVITVQVRLISICIQSYSFRVAITPRIALS